MQVFGTGNLEDLSMTKSSRFKQQHFAMRSFFAYLKRYKLRVFFVAIPFLISNILISLIPLFIGKLVGSLASSPVHGHQAVIYTWILIGCSTGHNIFWRAGEFMHRKYLNPISYEYENLLFKRVINQPYPYFVDKFTGKVSSYITTISQEFRDFINNIFYNYISQVVSLVIILYILASINIQTGLLFVLVILLMLIAGKYTIKNSTKYEKFSADVQSTKNGKLTDAIANFVNVKSFQREQAESELIALEQQKTVKASEKAYFWAIFFWASMSFFVRDIMWPATIGLNVYLFLHGQLSVAQLATILTTILLFSATIWDLIWQFSQFNLKQARVEEAHQYLFGKEPLRESDFDEQNSSNEVPEFNDNLVLSNLSFAYPDKPETKVLHNISITIKKGEKVGIVGKSGSGKTTLTKLMLGYYDIDQSQMFLDGVQLRKNDLAKLISYVPQDTTLFHRTVAENIAYAVRRKVSREEVVAAAKKAHADEFIAQISDGYDAQVGERGVKLSAGQRQRIAIARALLDNKPLLILDEATSALDSESEVLVQQGLEALWEQKTVIAIAHRLSTLRHMDKIVVMEKGKIIESGTHTELLNAQGTYAKLWNHQSGGFIEE
jgi:ATP-binding cassette, subfamily B, bacterial